jgi:hypothetical protein
LTEGNIDFQWRITLCMYLGKESSVHIAWASERADGAGEENHLVPLPGVDRNSPLVHPLIPVTMPFELPQQ